MNSIICAKPPLQGTADMNGAPLDRYAPHPPPPPPPGGPPPLKSKGSRSTRPVVGMPPPPPPGTPPSKKKKGRAAKVSPKSRTSGQSIVEQRRKAAIAMYESMDLVEEESPSFMVKSPIIPVASASTTSSQDTPNENRAPPRTSFSMKPPTMPPKSSAGLQSPQSPSPSRRSRSRSSPQTTLGTPTGTPNSEKSDSKKGFFRKMIARKESPSRANKSPSPNRPSPRRRPSRESPNRPSSKGRESPNKASTPTRSQSPSLGVKGRRAKKKEQQTNLGMPLGAKPGTSYKSTPHSAEIVPRKQSASVDLTVETALDDGQLEMVESFSPPRFDHPEYNDLPRNAPGSRGDRAFPDDISNLTDPSFMDGSPAKHPPSSNRMERIGEEDANGDPFGNYWDKNAPKADSAQEERGADPFNEPFFVDEGKQSAKQRKERRPDPSRRNPLNPDEVADRLFGVQIAESDEAVQSRQRSVRRDREEDDLMPSRPKLVVEEDEDELMPSPQKRQGPPSPENKHLMNVLAAEKRRRSQDTERELALQRAQAYDNHVSRADSEQIAQKAFTSRAQAELLEQRRKASRQAEREKKERKAAAANPATRKALDLLRKKDARPSRPKSSPTAAASYERKSGSTNNGHTSSIPRRRPPHMRSLREVAPPPEDEVLVPARAPTLAFLSRIAKQGRKPLFGGKPPPRSKVIIPKQKKTRSMPIPPKRRTPQKRTFYTKKRRKLMEPHIVAIGMHARYTERQHLINRGTAKPIIPGRNRNKPKSSVEAVDESKMDPIQRAGYRLLSKAAVPIQTEIRRFLAQQEAVERMWALIEIQSYVRRWRCESYRYAHTWAATKIQAAFRGSQLRDELDEKASAAISIQRVVRGYLSTLHVYDKFYSLITLQSVVRGWIARRRAGLRLGTAIIVQSFCRMCLAQLEVEKLHDAATYIQSMYRGYSAMLHFQFDIVDVIIVQSVVRRWKARKITDTYKDDQQTEAATVIQKNWRTFQVYSDYVFSIADILVAQRTARGWLARREARRQFRGMQATKIQAQWRRYKSQMTALYKLVHIIIIQSVIRRRAAANRARRMRIEVWAAETIQSWWRVRSWVKEVKCHVAATKIQANWRRFWGYSHYLIVGYEVVRIQALYRGHRARTQSNLQMGCAIIIQSMMRRFLAFKNFQEFKMIRVLVTASSECLRENNAAKGIQRAWRGSAITLAERHAANVIQKFFRMVKAMVDTEIRRQKISERKKSSKKKKRRGKNDSEENVLERAWLNTVDRDPYGRRAKGSSRERVEGSESSTTHKTPPEAVDVRPFDEVSEVTAPTVFHRSTVPSRANTLSRKEMSEDLSLEEAWIDTEVRQVKQRLQAEHEYLKRHGLQHHGSYQQPRDARHYPTTPRRGARRSGDMHKGGPPPPMRQHSPLRQRSPVGHQSPARHASPRRADGPYPQGPPRGQGRPYYEGSHPSPGCSPSPVAYQGGPAPQPYYEKPRAYPDSQSQSGYYPGSEGPRGRHNGYGSPRHEGPTQRSPPPPYHGDYNSVPDRNGYYRN